MNPIDIYMVSGFLGSGKTTFLTKFLESFQEKKVGILVNELGVINIDGMLIERDGIQMTEITSGSIYCYCKQGDFIQVLRTFSVSDIDVLLIENSGMADPSNIHRILPQGTVESGRDFIYKGAICILDAMTFVQHVHVLPSIANQVRASNFIILNKVDMVNQVRIEQCKQEILRLNSTACIYETIYADIPFSVIETYLQDNGYDEETTNKCFNKFQSYSLETKELVTIEAVQQFVCAVKPKVYRIKGFIKTQEKWLHLDVVEDYVSSQETTLLKKQQLTTTKLVFIGKDEKPYDKWLIKQWMEIVGTAVVVYS